MRIISCQSTLSEKELEDICAAIKTGQAIVFPTDTVYGIGADPASSLAVNRVLAAKGRGRQMPPPVLLANPQQAELVATQISSAARALMEDFWPGALTLILRTGDLVKYDLGDLPDTIAVRIPNHPAALQILEKTGPLAVTSANLTGAEPAENCRQAIDYFGEKVAVYVDGGATAGVIPSTIVSCVAETKILRQGVISDWQIQQVVETV